MMRSLVSFEEFNYEIVTDLDKLELLMRGLKSDNYNY